MTARSLSSLATPAPPEAPAALSRQVVAFVQKLRALDLFKLPGVAETIDWAKALTALDARALDPQIVDDTLGVLLKYQDDIAKVSGAEAAALCAPAGPTSNADPRMHPVCASRAPPVRPGCGSPGTVGQGRRNIAGAVGHETRVRREQRWMTSPAHRPRWPGTCW